MFLTTANLTQQAQIAADNHNWSLVTQCLQQLLHSGKKLAQHHIKRNGVKVTSQTVNHHESDSWVKIDEKFLLDLAFQALEYGDFQERWEVAKILPNLGTEAIAPLIEILQDEEADWELRWFAGQIIGQFDSPEVIPVLMDLVSNDTDEELSLVAAEALANIGPNAIHGLQELLTNDSSRLFAVRALAKIHRAQIIDSLLTVVNDHQPLVRATALAALSNFDDPRIPPLLVAGLADPVAEVRREATIGLGLCSMSPSANTLPENLVDLLGDRLWDLNFEVCQQAAISLMRVGTEPAATALFEVLKQPATPVPLAVTVVHRLGWMSHQASVDYLQQALNLPLSPEVFAETIAGLGRVEQPALKSQATNILLDLLASEATVRQQPKIKQAIAISLGQLAQNQAIAPLIKLLRDPNQAVRLHAIAALKHFDISES